MTIQRDKAWSLIPYPCIGGFRFLTLSLHPPPNGNQGSSLPSYPFPFFNRVMEKLTADDSAEFLDIGCCFGQDVRAVAFYASRYQAEPNTVWKRVHGLDICRDLIELGHELFRDKESFKGSFHVGNILSSP